MALLFTTVPLPLLKLRETTSDGVIKQGLDPIFLVSFPQTGNYEIAVACRCNGQTGTRLAVLYQIYWAVRPSGGWSLSVSMKQIDSLHILRTFLDPHNDHLPVGLIAQLVEHCTGIAEVRDRIPFGPEFFRSFFRYCLRSIAELRWSLTLKLFQFAVQMKFH